MSDNKNKSNMKSNINNNQVSHIDGTCCVINCLQDVCGGAYQGCGVGGWIVGDGDLTPDTDCSDSRFKSECE